MAKTPKIEVDPTDEDGAIATIYQLFIHAVNARSAVTGEALTKITLTAGMTDALDAYFSAMGKMSPQPFVERTSMRDAPAYKLLGAETIFDAPAFVLE